MSFPTKTNNRFTVSQDPDQNEGKVSCYFNLVNRDRRRVFPLVRPSSTDDYSLVVIYQPRPTQEQQSIATSVEDTEAVAALVRRLEEAQASSERSREVETVRVQNGDNKPNYLQEGRRTVSRLSAHQPRLATPVTNARQSAMSSLLDDDSEYQQNVMDLSQNADRTLHGFKYNTQDTTTTANIDTVKPVSAFARMPSDKSANEWSLPPSPMQRVSSGVPSLPSDASDAKLPALPLQHKTSEHNAMYDADLHPQDPTLPSMHSTLPVMLAALSDITMETYTQQKMNNGSNGSLHSTMRQASLGRDDQPLGHRTSSQLTPKLQSSTSLQLNSNLSLGDPAKDLIPPDMSEEDMLKAALEASQLELQKSDAIRVAKKDAGIEPIDIDMMKENARQLRNICSTPKLRSSVLLTFAIKECEKDLENLSKQIEQDGSVDTSNSQGEYDVAALFDLHGVLLHTLESARDASLHVISGDDDDTASAKESVNISVQDEAKERDVFSLICALRTQQGDGRMKATVELLKFARSAELNRDEESIRLREDLRSLGGIYSLLSLFQTTDISYELRAMAALAVAYVLPAFVVSEAQAKPITGINIVKCLRFLSTCNGTTASGVSIDKSECFQAATMGLLTFWNNQCESVLFKTPEEATNIDCCTTLHNSMLDQPDEMIEVQELLEMTVSLILHVAKICETSTSLVGPNTSLLVEQACALEIARPIVVRDGVIKLLVLWIKSDDNEKVRLGVSSLQHLTSVQDKYMAGWIHSQIINEDALVALIKLTRDAQLGQDSRLRIAQILSALCVAPHTRAAVVQADSLNFLVDILYEHSIASTPEVALFAGKAITQLAAGALSRASIFSKEELLIAEYVPPDKNESIIETIVGRGALTSFITLARGPSSSHQNMAIEALRVLSEDSNCIRNTRAKLYEGGAAMSLCIFLTEFVKKCEMFGTTQHLDESLIKVIHDAMCSLSNMFEPLYEADFVGGKRQLSTSTIPNQVYSECCLQVIESGGIDALLQLLQYSGSQNRSLKPYQRYHIQKEVCRGLSLISPHLLHDKVADRGHSHTAVDILHSLCELLSSTFGDDDLSNSSSKYENVHELVFNSIASLAVSTPLRVIIVGSFLPYIVQARNAHGQNAKLSNSATQAFQSLDLADDETAIQVAGNNPALLADCFCLQRWFLLQDLVQFEIRKMLSQAWDTHIGPVKYVRALSNGFTTDLVIEKGSEIFGALTDCHEDIAESRLQLLREYDNIYKSHGRSDEECTRLDSCEEESLLSSQIYPMNGSRNEAEWIMSHSEAMDDSTDRLGRLKLFKHSSDMLSVCFPSTLLRDSVLPLTDFRPDASFSFRCLMMPKRKYYSFRREGQLVAYLCNENKAPADTFWSLSFTDSSFDGEFSESLVQALYLCPTVTSLSFSRRRNEDVQDKKNHGSSIISNLVASLPPWVSSLTFNRVFHERDLIDFISGIEFVSKLTNGSSRIRSTSLTNESTKTETLGQFWFLGIMNSTGISSIVWKSFFSLLSKPHLSNPTKSRPLSSLKLLDLSANKLGDELCANLLEVVYNRDSKCAMEQINLSKNCIGRGKSVFAVLQKAAELGIDKSDYLTGLDLSSNELYESKHWVNLLKWNKLKLGLLNLSSNALQLSEVLCKDVVQSLQEYSSLRQIDLSKNSFSDRVIDQLLYHLAHVQNELRLTELNLSQNLPELSKEQDDKLMRILVYTRLSTVRNYVDVSAGQQRINDNHQITHPQESESIGSRFTAPLIRYDKGFANDGTLSSRSAHVAHTHSEKKASGVRSSFDNKITVLFSAPLVFQDATKVLKPFAQLDFSMERELLWQCLKEAGRDIRLTFDCATHDRLLATIAKGCSCLHYSGHGHQQYLPFENGRGGPHWFEVSKIRELLAEKGGIPFKFVFVSACYSGLAGRTFAEAGIPHVVCCQQEFELKDAAALAFTRQFYLALAVGHTVKYSFEQGCKAVRATPNLQNANHEMKKFVLLPEDGDHDVPVFDARAVPEQPDKSRRRGTLRSASIRNLHVAGTSASDLKVRNMIQEDPSPSPSQFFLGREVDMFYILDMLLQYRLVNIVGPTGIGRSSVARALCHYINERASTMPQIEHIYFVKVRRSHKKNAVAELGHELHRQLVKAGKASPLAVGSTVEDYFESICSTLKTDATLIVFNRIGNLEDSDETNAFPALLKTLSHETRSVKVLITSHKPLGIPSLNDHPYNLEPLNFANTVKLFSNLCTYLHSPVQRKKFVERLTGNPEQSELLPTDPGLGKDVDRIFEMLGRGIPSQIEKAAYTLGKEAFMSLNKGEVPRV